MELLILHVFILPILYTGNALGMIGVSTGVGATLGLLQPNLENFTQMAAAMGSGKPDNKLHLHTY